MRVIIVLIGILSFQGSVHANGCPANPLEWQLNLEKLAKGLIPDLGNDDLYKRGPKLLPVSRYQKVLSFWKNCNKYSNKFIQNKFSNILKHSQFMALSQSEGHSGFEIRDEDHLLNSLSKSMLFAKIPNTFFKNNYLPNNWKEQLKECKNTSNTEMCKKIKNWSIIEFHSTLEDGSGQHRRVIVQIPHKSFQQYLLFFPDHTEHKKTKLVDIIAMQTHNLQTHKKFDRAKPHFFERNKKGFAKDGGRCISCHTNGLREINPIQGTVTDTKQAQVIKEFNTTTRKLGAPNWSELIDYSALGPPMGKSCIQCHSFNKKRSPLTMFTKPSLVRSKIHEHEMPKPDFFKAYFDQIKSIPITLNQSQKKEIREIALSQSALANTDYRTANQIRSVRLKILRELLKQGHLGYLKYYYIGALDYFGSIYSDYKLSTFYKEYKKELFNWLVDK